MIRTNAGEVADRLRRKAADAVEAAPVAVQSVGDQIAAELADASPVDSGDLAASWASVPSSTGAHVQALDYAPYVMGDEIVNAAARARSDAPRAVADAVHTAFSGGSS